MSHPIGRQGSWLRRSLIGVTTAALVLGSTSIASAQDASGVPGPFVAEGQAEGARVGAPAGGSCGHALEAGF